MAIHLAVNLVRPVVLSSIHRKFVMHFTTITVHFAICNAGGKKIYLGRLLVVVENPMPIGVRKQGFKLSCTRPEGRRSGPGFLSGASVANHVSGIQKLMGGQVD